MNSGCWLLSKATKMTSDTVSSKTVSNSSLVVSSSFWTKSLKTCRSPTINLSADEAIYLEDSFEIANKFKEANGNFSLDDGRIFFCPKLLKPTSSEVLVGISSFNDAILNSGIDLHNGLTLRAMHE